MPDLTPPPGGMALLNAADAFVAPTVAAPSLRGSNAAVAQAGGEVGGREKGWCWSPVLGFVVSRGSHLKRSTQGRDVPFRVPACVKSCWLRHYHKVRMPLVCRRTGCPFGEVEDYVRRSNFGDTRGVARASLSWSVRGIGCLLASGRKQRSMRQAQSAPSSSALPAIACGGAVAAAAVAARTGACRGGAGQVGERT